MARKKRLRIAAFSYLHADNAHPLSVFSEWGVSDRLGDSLAAVATVWARAADEGADAILFLGDLFHRRRPDPTTLSLVARSFASLQGGHAFPLVLVPGNHDTGAAGGDSTVDVFTALGLENARVPQDTEERGALVLKGGGVDFLGYRYERPPETIGRLESLPAGKRPRVLLLHNDVTGVVDHGWTCPDGISRRHLADAVATLCGHYHTPQVLPREGGALPVLSYGKVDIPPGAVLYLGAATQLNFGDEGGLRGMWLLDFEGGDLERAEFMPLGGPRFLTVDIDPTATPHDLAVRVGEDIVDNGPLTFLKVRCRAPRHLLDAIDRDAFEREARLTSLRELKERALDDDALRGITWELEPVHEHTARAPLDAKAGLRQLVEAYVESGAVDLDGLDEEDVLDAGLRILDEVEGKGEAT